MHSFRNNIQLEGNLGKDAELKTTANGDVRTGCHPAASRAYSSHGLRRGRLDTQTSP